MARSDERQRVSPLLAPSGPSLDEELAAAGLHGDRHDLRALLDSLRALGLLDGRDEPLPIAELSERIAQLVAAHREAESPLEHAYQLLQAVTEGINDAVFVKDRDGRYLMINAAGAARAGRTVSNVLGRDDTELFPAETAHRLREEDRCVMREGASRIYEDVRLIAGTARVYLSTKAPYRDAAGHIIGIVGISRDITDRKQTVQELREAKEVAEAANRAKDQFLAVLSHELRTPLTPVLASVTYIESRPNLCPDMRRELQMIRRNIEMEARLIDDLLDLTRISRGKIELHFEALDAHVALRRALEICQSEIAAKRQELSLGLWAQQHVVWADPARMQQVFWNLIRNAVKFTPDGGRIALRTANDAQGRLEVQVSDTGIGIPPHLLSRIFDAFEQGERTKSRRFGGLGLGLAVSKALVDMHGAELTAESDGPDKGATFTLRIATVSATVPDPPPTPAERAPRTQAGLRILLVEDHEDTLMMMARLLKLFGHTVETAGSVREAVDLGHAREFDLLISDIGLPDGSGLDIIRDLKPQRGLKGIALSGYGMEEDRRQSREAGFDAHLTKPIDVQTLERAIAQVVV